MITMHLSIFQSTRIIDLYLYYKNVSNVFDIIKTFSKERFNIVISMWGVRDIIKKWKTSGSVQDRPRNNKHKLLITNEGLLVINKLLLSNPFMTSREIKEKLNLVAASKTVRNYIETLGWRKVNTKSHLFR
jgi:hypothetical protein